MESAEIRTVGQECCRLCQEEGAPLYRAIADRLFGSPQLWGFSRCTNCGFIWLNPRPVRDDLGKTYSDSYCTHVADAPKSRMEILQEKIALPILVSAHGYVRQKRVNIFGKIQWKALSKLPWLNDIARRYSMNLRGDRLGTLLDVGCGDGKFLADMRSLGWRVQGVEPDPKAALIAKDRFGLSVFQGMLADAAFRQNSFDAICMRHVIEHVDDPLSLIREAHRLLKPGGKLVLATPNAECLQHRLFRSSWMELDPPRHLQLFTPRTLTKLLALAVPGGFHIEDVRTLSGNTAQISVVSRSIRKNGTWYGGKLSVRQIAEGIGFLAFEEGLKIFSPTAGEELFLTASSCISSPAIEEGV